MTELKAKPKQHEIVYVMKSTNHACVCVFIMFTNKKPPRFREPMNQVYYTWSKCMFSELVVVPILAYMYFFHLFCIWQQSIFLNTSWFEGDSYSVWYFTEETIEWQSKLTVKRWISIRNVFLLLGFIFIFVFLCTVSIGVPTFDWIFIHFFSIYRVLMTSTFWDCMYLFYLCLSLT